MLAYMEKKYKEQFAMVGSYGGQMGKEYIMAQVRSKNRPKDIALVRVTYTEEGNIYQDNYLSFCLKDDIEKVMEALARQVYGECKVYYKTSKLVYPEAFGPEMDVDTFLKHPGSMVMMLIYPKEYKGDRDAQLEAFAELLREKNYRIRGVISYPEKEEMYNALTRDNYFRDGWSGYCATAEAVFSMNEEGGFKYVSWKDEEAAKE